jgi:integrase
VSSSKPTRRIRVERGIYRRPGGSFEVGWRDATGRQRWRTVDGGVMAARRALAEAHTQRARGERPPADPRLTFAAAADRWWEGRAVRLRPATQASYAARLQHVRGVLGHRRLTDISSADVAAYVADRETEAKGWTVRGELVVVNSVFAFAVRHLGFQGSNPVAVLDRVERPSSADQRPKRVLDGQELTRLLAAVDEPHRVLFQLAAETGARLSEVLGLVWRDVDFEAQAVTFAMQLDRQGRRQELKTARSRRTLEVTPALIAALRARRLASRFASDGDFVFASRTGTALEQRNIGGRVLARAVAAAKLAEPAPTFHSLRHSHGSRLVAQGWDVEEVSDRLGHADSATTLRTYVREFDKVRRSDDRRRRLAALYANAAATRGVRGVG